jgi:hypothetical protein
MAGVMVGPLEVVNRYPFRVCGCLGLRACQWAETDGKDCKRDN